MLNPEQMVELVDSLQREFAAGKLEEIIASLNRSGRLIDFLKMMGLEMLLNAELLFNPRIHGKIVVLGDSRVKEEVLTGIGKDLGFNKRRFEFCLSYDDVKTFPFSKLRHSNNYAAVVVGPIPHKTTGTGDYSSAIAAMEAGNGYPPVYRIEKINKSSFRSVMEKMLSVNAIAV